MTKINGPECHDSGCRGYGSAESGIVFIGIAPGREEVKEGIPLVGQSGKLLNAVLKAIEVRRRDVYCTNLICWWNNTPTIEEIERCNSRLKEELAIVKPKLIVCLGKIVSEYFLKRDFGKVRGAVQWSDEYDCYILSTFHPSGILQSSGDTGSGKDDKGLEMLHDFVRDLKKMTDVVSWPVGAPEAQVEYEVVDNWERAQQVLNELPTDQVVAIDVETDYDKDDEDVDLDNRNNLLCLSVGTRDFAWVFTPKAMYVDNDPQKPYPLIWPELHWTMHNAIFDVQVIRIKLGIWLDIKEDTMLQSYSLDERSGLHRLKTLSREYLAAGFYEEDRYKGKVKMRDLPPDVLHEYNAKDVVYTARLCEKFKTWQIADNVRDFYARILVPSINMYKEIQFRGAAIDRKLHREFGLMWLQRQLDEEERLQDWAEQEGFDGRILLSSPQQIAKLLYQILSLPILVRTKKGAPSTDKKVLEKLKGKHPFVDAFLDYRHLSHMNKLYIVGLMEQLKQDGRAHSIIKLHGSRTGRPSYTNPALQTIPTPYNFEDDFGLLRRLFIASPIEWVRNFNVKYGLPEPPAQDEEMVIIEADFGKAEIWMAYTESGDPQILADLIGGDYHSTVSADIFEKPIEEVTGADRLIAKRTTFGIMYWVEAGSLGELIKRTRQQAQSYIDRWFARYPVYRKWFLGIEKVIREKGELITKTGRKRRLIIMGSPVRVLKQAVNFPIQSTANDLLQEAALEAHPKLKEIGGHLLFTVHDAILAEVPRSMVPQAVQILHDAMTRKRYPDIVQIPVEIKVGLNWGQGKEVHDCASPEHKQKDNPYGVPKFGSCLWETAS